MSAQSLSSRAIIGEFYMTLDQDLGETYIPGISMEFDSDQASEEYRWLGMAPQMKEWLGGRDAKGLRDNGITIANKHYEATLGIPVEHIRRDKTGQVMIRVRELARRTNSHWASLLSTLNINGESTVCYDGQFFYDTDHSEGDSGTQSNDISVDISALPTTNHGSVTAPSVGEMAASIRKGIQQIYSFKDDQAEPLNENARNFIVMVPTPLFESAEAALVSPLIDSGEANILTRQNRYTVTAVPNPRLDASWTDKFSIFNTDGDVKAFIRQNETAVQLNAIAEGSEHEFKENEWLFGVDAWRNAGYGFWQKACLVTMI